MRRFKYTLLVAIGVLFFAATQYASGTQDVKSGPPPAHEWGSGVVPPAPNGAPPEVGSCGSTTLRFDELPTQPVNGLIFRGVIFRFFVGDTESTDAVYNGSGPGIQTFVQDPSLEGTAFGRLELDFPASTPTLSFGIARNTTAPLFPGATVELIGPGPVPIGTFPVNLAPTFLGGFAEGQFSYGGPIPVIRAIIRFNSPTTASRFAIDNLSYVGFPIVLQDDANPDLVLQFNPFTGDYEFINCATGLMVFGRGGSASNLGCILAFGSGGGFKGGPNQVTALVNTCARSGTATVRIGSSTFNISDSNIDDNLCCEEGGENKQAVGNKLGRGDLPRLNKKAKKLFKNKK